MTPRKGEKVAKRPVGHPRKWKSPADMQAAIDRYFADTSPPYTVTGLALSLDMTRRGLLDYEERGEFAHTIQAAKARVEAETERRMVGGEGWGPGHIFSLKNNFGWRDEHQVVQTGKQEIVVRYADKDADDGHAA